MLKTKTTIREKAIYIFACFIASCVLMLSVHAKDLVYYSADAAVAERVGYNDISSKAAGELHNHIDKQVVKTFDKGATGDNYVMNARGKEDIDILNEEDPGLWGRLHEVLLIWKVYASLPFSA